MENLSVGRYVADGPLAEPRARQSVMKSIDVRIFGFPVGVAALGGTFGSPEYVAASLVNVLLQSGLHFVVGEERNVAGVRDGQYLPIPQQRVPRLE